MKVLKGKTNELIILIYFLFFFFFMIEDGVEIAIPLFFKEYKFHMLWYGVLLSATKIIRAIIVIPISIWSEHRKIFCLKCFILADMFFLVFLIYSKNFIISFICFSLLLISTSVLNVIMNPMLGRVSDDNKRGIVFGIRDAFLYFGCFLGLIISGELVDKFATMDFLWYSYIGGFVIILAIVVAIERRAKKEISKENQTLEVDEGETKKGFFGLSQAMRYYLLINFILGMGGACTGYLPLAALDMGIQTGKIFYIFSSSTFIAAILAILGGIAMDRYNKKKIFQLDILLFVFILILYLTNNKILFLIAIIISGFSTAFDNVANLYVFENFTEEEVNCFWGYIGSVSLIAFSVGSVLCGFFYEIGIEYVFLWGLACNMIGLIMSFKLKIKRKVKIDE